MCCEETAHLELRLTHEINTPEMTGRKLRHHEPLHGETTAKGLKQAGGEGPTPSNECLRCNKAKRKVLESYFIIAKSLSWCHCRPREDRTPYLGEVPEGTEARKRKSETIDSMQPFPNSNRALAWALAYAGQVGKA